MLGGWHLRPRRRMARWSGRRCDGRIAARVSGCSTAACRSSRNPADAGHSGGKPECTVRIQAAPVLISMAEIARLAGQSRATVGNWKARNPEDFPRERGHSGRGPLYDRAEVVAWLEATNRLDSRPRSEEHTSELQSRGPLVCRL